MTGDAEMHEECDECGGCGYVAIHEATGERLTCAACEGCGYTRISSLPPLARPHWYDEARRG